MMITGIGDARRGHPRADPWRQRVSTCARACVVVRGACVRVYRKARGGLGPQAADVGIWDRRIQTI